MSVVPSVSYPVHYLIKQTDKTLNLQLQDLYYVDLKYVQLSLSDKKMPL